MLNSDMQISQHERIANGQRRFINNRLRFSKANPIAASKSIVLLHLRSKCFPW
jgi:hypothetical protein